MISSPEANPFHRKPHFPALGLAWTILPAPQSPPGPSPHLNWNQDPHRSLTNARRPLLPQHTLPEDAPSRCRLRPLLLPEAGLPLVPGRRRSTASLVWVLGAEEKAEAEAEEL